VTRVAEEFPANEEDEEDDGAVDGPKVDSFVDLVRTVGMY